jgi:hypothetical protein
MTKEEERQKLYKLEKEIVEKGAEFYYSIVRGKDDDYLKYVISKRINAFRDGLYPTTKKIILHELSEERIHTFEPRKQSIQTEWLDYNVEYFNTSEIDIGATSSYNTL